MIDLAIAYRIYPGVSKTPIIHSDDKLKLSEVALASFKRSLGDLRIKMWAILDGCPSEYEALFKKYFNDTELTIVHCNTIGNGATFSLQLDLLLRQTDADYLYLAEDDYFYLDNGTKEIIEFMNSNHDVDFVTAYDHPDYYQMDFHNTRESIRVHGSHHWRTAMTTCLTFLARRSALKKAESVFRTFARKNYDTSIWMALTKRGCYNLLIIIKSMFADRKFFVVYAKAWLYTPLQLLFGRKYSLWCPLPSLATHLERTGVAPVIEWEMEPHALQ
jgi:hypothetical protein